MAQEKTQEKVTKVAEKEERVEIYIEKGDSRDDPNFFVSVNGKNYVLPKGETSLVPKHIADEIKRSRKAAAKLDRRRAQIKELSKAPTNM